jgi:hypothetical protein
MKYFAIAGAVIGALYALSAGYQSAGVGGGGVAAVLGAGAGGIAGALAFTVLRLAVVSALIVLPIAVIVLILFFTWNKRF